MRGIVPKPHGSVWFARKNSVTPPGSMFAGVALPRITTFLPFKPFTHSGKAFGTAWGDGSYGSFAL